MFAAHHGLNNLTIIIDNNNLQSLEKVLIVHSLKPLDDKLRAFGWNVYIVNGHNHNELKDALSCAKIILASCCNHAYYQRQRRFMENSVAWHYRSPNDDELHSALVRLFCHEECSDQLVDA